MNNNYEVESLYLDTDVLEVYKEGLFKGVQDLDNNSDETTSSFGKLGQNNIYKNGLNRIQKGLSETRETLYNCLKVNEEYVERFINLENKGKAIVQNIDIPSEFAVSSSTRNTTYGDTSISKKDGTSINKGVLGLSSVSEDEYDKEKEELKDILKEEKAELKETEKSTILKEELKDDLKDIENSVDNTRKTKVEKVQVDDINNATNKDTLEEKKEVNIEEGIIANLKKDKEDNAVVENIEIENEQPVLRKIEDTELPTNPQDDDNEVENTEEIKEDEDNDN